ncbi:hypothetical protein HORM4_1040035 [Vibrio harveyi]|nr:hypothetical protein HORM4_1040035 [Vibrio harveyi]
MFAIEIALQRDFSLNIGKLVVRISFCRFAIDNIYKMIV